jgi:cell division protein FtsN
MRNSVPPAASRFRQRGGFLAGLIVGLLVGLALALGVALYVTKVPVPFLDKVPQRTAEQDSAEREKNKNWEPNAPLAGKNPAHPVEVPPVSTEPATPVPAERDPASILADRPIGPTPTPTPTAAKNGDEAYVFFVQTGAYSSLEDAEGQRGKLALLGYSARIVEREQSGRTVHRVRLGPFEEKTEADDIKAKVTAAGFEAALVRALR